jgi:hypothetical protein
VLWAVLGRIANAAINRMLARRIRFLQVWITAPLLCSSVVSLTLFSAGSAPLCGSSPWPTCGAFASFAIAQTAPLHTVLIFTCSGQLRQTLAGGCELCNLQPVH